MLLKCLFPALGFLLLHACPAAAQSSFSNVQCCRSVYTGAWDTLDLKQLRKEYKRLKSLKCVDCAHFQSDLMLVMEVLGRRLDGSRKGRVRKIMGKPDEREDGQLIYHWRNRHDYLYFTMERRTRTMKQAWYYAYE